MRSETRPRSGERPPAESRPSESGARGASSPVVNRMAITAAVPKTGIEILAVEERVASPATRSRSERWLDRGSSDTEVRAAAWRQAILDRENGLPDPDAMAWREIWLCGQQRAGRRARHILAFRDNGEIRYFYAVSDDGINDAWRTLVPAEGA